MTNRRFTHPHDVSEVLGVPFSDEQLAAITAPLEPGVVIAGAGSGKTTVMAARVVWLVGTGVVRPDQVLGLTFTRKAAAELSTRVRQALRTAGIVDDEADDLGEQVILTYDSFASQLVADHGLRLGVESEARTITGAQRFQLASRVVAAAPGPFAELSRLKPDSVTNNVLSLDSALTSHLVDLDAVRAHSDDFCAAVETAPRRGKNIYASLRKAATAARERVELIELVANYQQLKDRHQVVEFADRMATAALLAQTVPEVSQALRDQFAVVLLDEYQDTSAAQVDVLRALFSGDSPSEGRGHPVTAVGDPRQAIYGWRGAAAANITAFADTFPLRDGTPARSYALSVNRRSGPVILAAANHIAAGLQARMADSDAAARMELVAPPGAKPGSIVTASFDTVDNEVEWIANRIVAAHESGQVAQWSDIAVLCRRNSALEPIYAALTSRDVPVDMVGLSGLLHVPEVADVVAMLRVLADMTANPDVIRLLSGARWAIGPKDLAQLGRRAAELAGHSYASHEELTDDVMAILNQVEESAQLSLVEALDDPGQGYSAEGAARLVACAAELRLLRRHVTDPVNDVVRRVVTTMGLDVELGLRGPHGLRQLQTFIQAVSSYAEADVDGSLAGLVAWLRAEELHGDGLEQAAMPHVDAVQLLTAHRAKGLEWDMVFLPDLADGVFPNTGGVDNWLTKASVLPHELRGDADAVPQLNDVTNAAANEFDTQLKQEARLSEDRLAYVAVTRARQHIVASTHAWSTRRTTVREPSPYFAILTQHGSLVVDEAISDSNPALAESSVTTWPSIYDEADQARRDWAAAAVRRYRQGAAEPTPPSSLDEATLLAAWDDATTRLISEARARRRPDRGPTLPRYVTATSLRTLTTDPDTYLANLLRPMPRRPSQAARVGEDFHSWLERRFASTASLVDVVEPGGASPALQRLITAFEAGHFADRTPTATEVPFALVIGGQVVRGRIDAVFTDRDRIQIVDWKTGDADRADPLQLAVYRLAWAEINDVDPDQIDALFFDVLANREVRPAEALLQRADLEQLLDKVAG